MDSSCIRKNVQTFLDYVLIESDYGKGFWKKLTYSGFCCYFWKIKNKQQPLQSDNFCTTSVIQKKKQLL